MSDAISTNRALTIMKTKLIALLLGFTFCAFLNGTAFAQAKKPNILVIFGDDIGQTNVSAYSMGLMGYRTPNIVSTNSSRKCRRASKPLTSRSCDTTNLNGRVRDGASTNLRLSKVFQSSNRVD